MKTGIVNSKIFFSSWYKFDQLYLLRFFYIFQLFQERPIWSKNALKAHLEMTPEHYKIILPTVAYFYTTGPWRSLWVRLGYDPRKDPSSKKYQLVDFRVRQSKVPSWLLADWADWLMQPMTWRIGVVGIICCMQRSWSYGWCKWLYLWYMYAHTPPFNAPERYAIYRKWCLPYLFLV